MRTSTAPAKSSAPVPVAEPVPADRMEESTEQKQADTTAAGFRRFSAYSSSDREREARVRRATATSSSLGLPAGGASPAVPPRKSSHLTAPTGLPSNKPTFVPQTSAFSSYNSGLDGETMLNCVGKRLTRPASDVPRQESKQHSPNLDRHNPPPPTRLPQTTRHPAATSSNLLPQRPSSHQTTDSVAKIGSLPTDRVPTQQGKLLEFVQARAIASFHDTTFRSSLSFLKDDIICVFVDSMTASTGYSAPANHPTALSAPWWRGFRAAEGPSTTGFFPSSSVILLHPTCPILQAPLPHLASATNPQVEATGGPRKRADLVDFAIQTDALSSHDTSSCTSTGSVEEDGEEGDFPEDEDCPLEEQRSASTTGNEAALQVEAVVLREIEALADTARLLPMTSDPSAAAAGVGFKSSTTATATSMSTSSFAQRTTPPQATVAAPPAAATGGAGANTYGTTGSLESSNRNSSTSLDSGRGSAYATSSSEGGKQHRICSPPAEFAPLPYAATSEHVTDSNHHAVSRVSPRHVCTWGSGGGGVVGTDQLLPGGPGGRVVVGDVTNHPCRSSPTHSSPASSTSGVSYLAESRRLRLHHHNHPPGGPSCHRGVVCVPPSVVPPSAPQQQPWNSTRTSCSSTASSIGSSSESSGGSSCSSCCLQTQLAECAAAAAGGETSSLELLKNWLSSAGFADYITCLASAGYDLGTLRRATPEDLNACGITNPRDRQQLRTRLARLQLPESLPDNVPPSVCEWLSMLNLGVYWPALQCQGFTTFERISALTWEDLEEVGISKLGHQKKMMLAIERIKKILPMRGDSAAIGLDPHCLPQSRRADGTQCSNMPAPAPVRPSTPQPLGTTTAPVSFAGISEPRPTSEGGHSDAEADLSDAGSTPPPPPAFQDPPAEDDDEEEQEAGGSGQTLEGLALDAANLPAPPPACKPPSPLPFVRKASLDSSALMQHRRSAAAQAHQPPPQSLHFSASHLSTLGDGGGGEQSGLPPPPKLLPDNYPAAVRQRYRSCNTVTIPVPNHVLPPPASGRTTDLELRDMQELRSTLDKLSQYLTPNDSP